MPHINKLCTTCFSVTSQFHSALHSLGSIMLSQMTGFPCFLNFLFYIGVQLVTDVVLVSDEQQSDSVIHIHISILSQIFFSFSLLQKIGHSFLCYTVGGSCWLFTVNISVCIHQGFPVIKNLPCKRHKRRGFDPSVGKIPWRRKRQPTSEFLPGKFHGWRSLAGHSPWGHKELNRTEQLSTYVHVNLF